MVSLFCVLCGEEFRSYGTIPPSCPRCLQTTRWTTRSGVEIPKVRWELNHNDRRLLHSMRIDAEEIPEIGTAS